MCTYRYENAKEDRIAAEERLYRQKMEEYAELREKGENGRGGTLPPSKISPQCEVSDSRDDIVASANLTSWPETDRTHT